HHDATVVEAALVAAGLVPVAVRGMYLDGSLTEDLDELSNTKAIFVARAPVDNGASRERATTGA
ncbi:MAG TPA: hypothetical protein VFR38_12835, partial [Gaiellaceae bacterium]|nr:hypothetical protein [Gaiellaceae bacterium]